MSVYLRFQLFPNCFKILLCRPTCTLCNVYTVTIHENLTDVISYSLHRQENKSIMLPLSLLRTAQNHPMLVELKNGETYNGHLVSCDNWMNINLREVICTSKDGDRFWRMPECYIRGSTIKYLRIPDEVIDMVKEEVVAKGRGRSDGKGRGGAQRGGRGGSRGSFGASRGRGAPSGRGGGGGGNNKPRGK